MKTDYTKLADEREAFDERIANIEEEKNAALDRAKKAEAEAEKLVGSMKILAVNSFPHKTDVPLGYDSSRHTAQHYQSIGTGCWIPSMPFAMNVSSSN